MGPMLRSPRSWPSDTCSFMKAFRSPWPHRQLARLEMTRFQSRHPLSMLMFRVEKKSIKTSTPGISEANISIYFWSQLFRLLMEAPCWGFIRRGLGCSSYRWEIPEDMKLAFGRWRWKSERVFSSCTCGDNVGIMWGYHGDIMGISWEYHGNWVRMDEDSLGIASRLVVSPKSRICCRSRSPGTLDKNTPQKPGLNTGWGPCSSSRSGALFQWLNFMLYDLYARYNYYS